MVSGLVQKMKTDAKEFLLKAENLFLSEKHDFLDKHVARFPIFPKRHGTFKLMDAVRSSVGPQDMDTGCYQVSDLEDIEFHWQNPELYMIAVFRPRKDTHFLPSIFDSFQTDSLVENPILIDKAQKKLSFPRVPPLLLISDRTTRPPCAENLPKWNMKWKCSLF